MKEFYIGDPVFQSTVRIVRDEGGLWYAFLADGAELVADTDRELAEQIGKYWIKIIKREAVVL